MSKADYDQMSAATLAAIAALKDEEIALLRQEKKELQEKIFECMSLPRPVLHKEPVAIKRPMIYDEKEKKLREKTPQEASDEFKALQELGILG
jgi:hypothetical protein